MDEEIMDAHLIVVGMSLSKVGYLHTELHSLTSTVDKKGVI